MYALIIFLIFILFLVYVYITIIKNRIILIELHKGFNENLPLIDYKLESQLYKYQKEDFPFNIFITNRTRTDTYLPYFYESTKKSIEIYNQEFNFDFFVLSKEIKTYPNVLLFQIVCGKHHTCTDAFDGKGGVLAHATLPPNRILCVDCADVTNKKLFVIIMHELGHILGLVHNLNPKILSLMNRYSDHRINGFETLDKKRIRLRFPFVS